MPESAPALYLNNKQPNLAFLSCRLTSSSDLASYALSRSSSSVQRSFLILLWDVIATTSWASDVVNLVRPHSDLPMRKATPTHRNRTVMMAIWNGSLAKWLRVRVRARGRKCIYLLVLFFSFFPLVLQNVMNIFASVASCKYINNGPWNMYSTCPNWQAAAQTSTRRYE